MSSYLVTETPLSQIRPVDPGLRPGLDELRMALRRHMDPEAAAEIGEAFADPVASDKGATIDWYTDWVDDTEPLSALSEDNAAKILEAVGEIRAAVQAVIDRLDAENRHGQDIRLLRAAINVPSNEGYLYSAGGRPVLVAWGYQLAEANAAPVPAGKWVERSAPVEPGGAARGAVGAGDTSAGSDGASQGFVARSGPVMALTPFPWLAWLLWTIFLLLILLIAYVLLTACSVGYPNLSLAQRSLNILNRCPVVVEVGSQDRVRLAEKGDALRQAIQDAEIALARDRQSCRVQRIREAELTPPPPVTAPVEEPPVVPEETPPPTTDEAELEEALERVRRAGGQEGEVQVVLEWDGPADLDIYIDCAGQSIAHNQRQNCHGGSLDVDANHQIDMDEPVENVHWSTTPPSGNYGIRVRNVKNQGDPRSEIPFKVHVRRGDEIQTFESQVGPRQTVDVTEFTIN